MTLRSHRFKQQRAGSGLFLGITAEAVRLTRPPALGVPVSARIRLDASEVDHAFYGNRLTLHAGELAWLRHGLDVVSGDIERAETSPYVLIVVRALEIFEADHHEAAFAPAIVGWATEEFALPPRSCTAVRDGATGRITWAWGAPGGGA